jgi:hypothetical protein
MLVLLRLLLLKDRESGWLRWWRCPLLQLSKKVESGVVFISRCVCDVDVIRGNEARKE